MNTISEQRQKPDISDLLPELKVACCNMDPTNADVQQFRKILAQVRSRYGAEVNRIAITVYGDCGEWHNATIDVLDRDHPYWRGYLPSYLQERLSA